MILLYQKFDLLDKVAIQRVVFEAPMKADSTMLDEACFVHVVNGKSTMYSKENQVSVNTNDSLVMKCGTYMYDWRPVEKGNKPNEAVFVHFYPDVLKLIYEDQLPSFLTERPKPNQKPIEKVQLDSMIGNYVNSLIYYFENPTLATDELIKLKVKELILLLVNSENSDRLTSLLSDMFNPSTYQFKQVINAHLYDDLSLDDFARLTGTSLSSFKRRFKENFNASPRQYIIEKRLSRAVELLSNTDKRISDITYDCGFNDIGHFSKSFSGRYGQSPTDYRKQNVS